MSARIRIGVGGWTYEPWRGAFYPQDLTQKRELEYAARQLSSIEINGTFYGLQKPKTFAKWHDETPPDFVFALKGPRYITHRKQLASAGPALERFLASGLTQLQGKLGPINWQLAPDKAFESEDVRAFFELLPPTLEGLPLRHAIEVRHESFLCAPFIELARSHGVAVVLAGDSDYPQIVDPTAPFMYARIMGTKSKEPSGYGAEQTRSWAGRARAWAAGHPPAGLAPLLSKAAAPQPRDVYLYVISGYKKHNPAAAMALIAQLEQR